MKNVSGTISGERLTVRIGKVPAGDHDQIDQCPNAASSAGDQHQETGSGFSNVETMDSKSPKEQAQRSVTSFDFCIFFSLFFILVFFYKFPEVPNSVYRAFIFRTLFFKKSLCLSEEGHSILYQ